ncbi:hypothetical protein PBY51_012201 [Eleginops maclovinus]|uniref:Uncharacterized protein n=1 Tax=Eleginops maclovinus TaxID=56733 RepID=A0AAN7XPR5_ELEMC|nr:hypothetical protein PBY51_012201 [Eleginops maclovinus]
MSLYDRSDTNKLYSLISRLFCASPDLCSPPVSLHTQFGLSNIETPELGRDTMIHGPEPARAAAGFG